MVVEPVLQNHEIRYILHRRTEKEKINETKADTMPIDISPRPGRVRINISGTHNDEVARGLIDSYMIPPIPEKEEIPHEQEHLIQLFWECQL